MDHKSELKVCKGVQEFLRSDIVIEILEAARSTQMVDIST